MAEQDIVKPERISSREVYRSGRLWVEELGLRFPDGHSSEYSIVRMREAVAVVAYPTPGHIALIKQYRPAVDRVLYEVPAGLIEEGETPEISATRQLREETGYSAFAMNRVASIHPAPGFCDETIHLCVARGVEYGKATPDPEEFIDVVVMPIAKAVAMARSGEISDAKTYAALLFTLTKDSVGS